MTAILVSYWDSNILRDSFIFQYYQTGPAGKCLTADLVRSGSSWYYRGVSRVIVDKVASIRMFAMKSTAAAPKCLDFRSFEHYYCRKFLQSPGLGDIKQ